MLDVKPISWLDLVNEPDSPTPESFGDWHYLAALRVLRFRPNTQDEWEIDLEEEATDAASLMDAVLCASTKTGITPKDLGDLVLAIRGVADPRRSGR